MFEGFRRGLRLFLGGSKPRLVADEERPHAPDELTSRDGFVRIHQQDGQVHLQPSFSPDAMLVLPGALDGSLNAVRGQAGGREAMLLSFPILVGGRSRRLQLTVARLGQESPGDGFQLVRASRRRVPPADQALEFVYHQDGSEVRYLVEMDLEIPPVGFREFTRHRAVFEEVPPVSQMVAFLKATIHQRRTALRSLSSLARRAEEKPVQDMVALMQETLSQSQDFSNPVLTDLQVDLQRVGRPINPNTLAAMTLLADIFLGNLGRPQLDDLLERGLPLETSLPAAEAAAAFLGVEPDRWRALRPEAPEGVEPAAAYLQKTVGQRTAMTILEDLAEDSGSERSRSRVARLRAKVGPDQVLTNDEHEALRLFLTSKGRPVQADTLAALGIYVDFEAGILSEEDIDALTPSRGFLDTSLYGMVAISGAFDAELRPFRLLAERQAQLWEGLIQLLRLSRGSLVARFLEPEQPGVLTLCLSTPSEVVKLRSRGLTFTGELLAHLPTLDYLSEPDLEVMARACPGLMASFGSEDKQVQWRRLDSVQRPDDLDLLKGRFNYIDGYRLFQFQGKVVARSQPVQPDELRWRKDFVTLYRDQRGNAHYRFFEKLESEQQLLEPPQHGLEWGGEVVEFPDLTGCPAVLYEPSHDFLLGRPEERGLKQQRLDRIYEGLESHLTQPWAWYNLAQHPQHLARLRSRLKAPALRAALVGVVDLSTRNALIQALSEQQLEFQVAEPLLQSLDLAEMEDFAVLSVLFRMCLELELPGLVKYYNQERFRELLLDRLFALTDSSDPVVRMQAARLMGSDLVAYAPQQQLAVSYVLSRFLENEKPIVARQAARSLAALSLEELLPLPETVQTRLLSKGKRKSRPGRAVDGQELEEIQSELDEWLQSSEAALSPLASRLADPVLVGQLSEWVARLNNTFRKDTSLADHRFLLVVPEQQLDRLLASSVTGWQEFAAERGSALSDLLQVDELPELVSEFRSWAENRDASLENLSVLHLGPSEACAVRTRGRLSPLFARMAEGLDSLRLVRWLPGEPRPLHDQPGTFLHPGRVWADELLVFRPRQHRFVAIYDRDTPLRRDPAIEKDLRALAGIASQAPKRAPAQLPPHDANTPPALSGLAVTVMGVFNIPSDSLRMVQTMLAGLIPRFERIGGRSQ